MTKVLAVVGDVIVKIDAPDAEDMQFKGGHDDDASSEEAPAQEEAKTEEAPAASASQDEEVMKIDKSKLCHLFVNMHVKKALTSKQ